MNQLFDKYLQNLPAGRIVWIGLRPERLQPMVVVEQAEAIAGLGLEGDRRCQGREGSARQVTLINQENIQAAAKVLGRDKIDPALLRRNLVVSGINLLALRGKRFRIGEVELEGTAACHPCGRMEQALGAGGFAAMLGNGGLCAKILVGGELRVGQSVELLPQNE
ncbi:MOSC domain-containing protein [Porticoccaceae bacterium LTM1]|nr:MOSC domain-containing protein [Porticoccaceae bacterium LTM1]